MPSPASSSSASDIESEKPSPPSLKRKRHDDVAHSDTDSDSSSPAGSSASSSDSSSEPDSDAEAAPAVSALSHAERRRQKKKEHQPPTDDTPSTPKRRKLAVATSTQPKRQNSVWVGNLSFKTTPEALRAFFDGVGEITRVHMPAKAAAAPTAKPENRGFAYVDFATPEAKAAAIARSEKPLIGRRLLIKDGDDFTGRPALAGTEGDASSPSDPNTPSHSKTAQKILRAQKQPPAPTLFLGNLGFEATEKSIRELLDAHRVAKKKPKGEAESEKKEEPQAKDKWIRKIRLGTFEDSGLCKGFAFVDFTSIAHATSALINPKNHHLDGRKLVVEYASADAVRRGGGGPKPAKEERAGTSRGGLANHSREGRRAKKEENHDGQLKEHAEEVERPAKEDDQAQQPRSRGDKGPRVRPKPGAALALAKRESAAIVPSRGQKITF